MFARLFTISVVAAALCTPANATHRGLNLDNYHEGTNSAAQGVCGLLPYDDENGFKYYVSNDGADDICLCNSSDMTMQFYYGGGCFCPAGYYNDIYASEWLGCQKCPSTYPLSNGYDEDTHSIGNAASKEDVCYRVYSVRGTNVNLTLQISMIGEDSGDDPYIVSAQCDAGYWLPNSFGSYYYGTDDNYSCPAVGENYYSVSDNSRTLCPTYTNAAGESVYGKTAGYGTGADDITDCAIPGDEIYTDASGTWVYDGGCNWVE